MMKQIIPLLLTLLIGAPLVSALSYTSIQITFRVDSDGVSTIDYLIETDPTQARISLPIVGTSATDLLVVNQDNTLLNNTLVGSILTVDTLGSIEIAVTYSTQSLTSKIGTIWSWNATTPAITTLILPSGATIIGFIQIPLQLGIIDGRPYATLPEGENSVSYILGVVGTKEHAIILINEAQTAITQAKTQGTIVTEAETLLTQANSAFNSRDYSKAESLALESKEKTVLTTALAAQTMSSIASAETAIKAAESQGRNNGLDAARKSIEDAKSKYQKGEYSGALQASNQATQQANTATGQLSLLTLFGAAAAAIALGGGIWYGRKRTRKQPAKQTHKTDQEGEIDLETLFKKNSDLRVEDREVLRFLAEHGGEIFANEIRERFRMPRTSAWRLIRRLEGMGVLEERKVGGQSLIRIPKKYRSDVKKQ